jgi:two-component system phosphate regulon sensor histidine kinase PhoR
MRIPLPLKVGLAGGGLAGLGLAAYLVASVSHVRAEAEDRLLRDLAAAATAMAQGIGKDGVAAADLDARVKEASRTSRLRFTVVAEDGRVLAESGVADLATIERHDTRPEIVQAVREGRGAGRRESRTVGKSLYYAAERIPGTRAVARAALEADEVEARIAEEARFPWLAAGAAVVLAALAAWALLRPAVASVETLIEAAGAIEAGRLGARVPIRGADLLRGLASSFNAMAERLEAAVERVNAERARLLTILDGMVEGVVAVDGDENVRFLNGAARAMLALAEEAPVEGRPIHALVRDPQVLSIVRAAIREGESREAEVVWDGAPKRLVRLHAAPVRSGGPGAILLARDISTLRRLERMRSDFVANVSHELRTPLAAISGAAETLAEGALEDREAALGFVQTIGRHADRLRALVDDLLTLSRFESTPESIERSPVDFAAVARQACEAVATRAQHARLTLEVTAEGPVRVLGDPEALRRLVDNLVVNALTYTPAGGRVNVGVRAEGGAAVLKVADTGIGIAPEHIERIFERFFRVDKARSRAKGGTGLGLAIVKHAVNLHGGEVRVVSRPGEGSVFTVRIPRLEDGEPTPREADGPAS